MMTLAIEWTWSVQAKQATQQNITTQKAISLANVPGWIATNPYMGTLQPYTGS